MSCSNHTLSIAIYTLLHMYVTHGNSSCNRHGLFFRPLWKQTRKTRAHLQMRLWLYICFINFMRLLYLWFDVISCINDEIYTFSEYEIGTLMWNVLTTPKFTRNWECCKFSPPCHPPPPPSARRKVRFVVAEFCHVKEILTYVVRIIHSWKMALKSNKCAQLSSPLWSFASVEFYVNSTIELICIELVEIREIRGICSYCRIIKWYKKTSTKKIRMERAGNQSTWLATCDGWFIGRT